jgi:hypothetical protein
VRRESAGRGGWPISARRVSSNGRIREAKFLETEKETMKREYREVLASLVSQKKVNLLCARFIS